MESEKPNDAIEYGQEPPGRRRRVWIWAIVIFVVAIWFFARWYGSWNANRWHQPWNPPKHIGDQHGNAMVMDEDSDSVGLVETDMHSPPGFGFSQTESCVTTGYTDPVTVVPVKLQKRTLWVSLPDGTTQEFPLPKGFGRQFVNAGFENTGLSLRRSILSLYPPGEDRRRLEAFMARSKEHTNYDVLPTPTTATSRS